MNARELADWIVSRTGHPLEKDEGIFLGDGERPVGKVLVTWMSTREALETAGRLGCTHVITHESPFFPYGAIEEKKDHIPWREWPTNRERLALWERHGLTLMRVHGSMDELTIFDAFAEVLGLGTPVEVRERFVKIYSIEPVEIDELTSRVKARMGMAQLRVAIPPGFDRRVSRIGLPWGGLGLFLNVGFQQKLIEAGVDALIGGESDSYGMRFACEIGIPFIETAHEGSENIGVRKFTEQLGGMLGLDAVYHECREAWKTV